MNVVGARNRVSAPITNGADLVSDAVCDNLFDDGEWMEQPILPHVGDGRSWMVVGFIDGAPVLVTYSLNSNMVKIKTFCPPTRGLIESYRKILQERLTDEQVESEIFANEKLGEYTVYMYYTDEWAKENLG